MEVVPTYGQRQRGRGGRYYRPRGANVLVWVLPADFFLKDKLAGVPSSKIHKKEPATIPDGLAAALARFGHAIADRAGLPKSLKLG
jgi:hypothetical protein